MAIYRTTVSVSAPSINGTGSNTFHYRTTSLIGEDEDELTTATQALFGAYDALRQFFPSGTIYTSDGRWQQIADPNPVAVQVTGWSTQADNNGPAAPSSTAQVITWRTALSAKSGRGRTFLGPVPATGVEANGTPTEGFRNSVRAAFDNLVDGSGVSFNGAFCVWSPTDNLARDFTGLTVPNEFAVLRSRRD